MEENTGPNPNSGDVSSGTNPTSTAAGANGSQPITGRNSKAGKVQLSHWVAEIPKVKTWSDNVDVRPSTLELYQSHLYLYGDRCLHNKYSDVETWLSRVKEQQRSEEKDIVNEWALDLQRFFKTYTVKNTGIWHGEQNSLIFVCQLSPELKWE